MENSALRRSGTDVGIVNTELLRGEALGMFAQTPDGWTLTEYLTDADIGDFLWLRLRRDARLAYKGMVTGASVQHGTARVDVTATS